MKKVIKLTESDIHRMVMEALNEIGRLDESVEYQERYNNRLRGMSDIIEYYEGLSAERALNEEQCEQLKEVRNSIVVFGESGLNWAMLANDILKDSNFCNEDCAEFEKMYQSELNN